LFFREESCGAWTFGTVREPNHGDKPEKYCRDALNNKEETPVMDGLFEYQTGHECKIASECIYLHGCVAHRKLRRD
jgi:hypothetical protein